MLTGVVGLVLGLIFLAVGILKHVWSKQGEKSVEKQPPTPSTVRRVTGSRPTWATHSSDIKDRK